MRPVRQAWVAWALAQETDECLLAPFTQPNGYAPLKRDGRTSYAHTEACEAEHGPRPDDMEAAHSCGRRNCANRRHLSWKTHAANMADQEADGTVAWGEAHGCATLTATDAAAIRSAPKAYGVGRRLARRYGVSPATITLIRQGKLWRRLEAAA